MYKQDMADVDSRSGSTLKQGTQAIRPAYREKQTLIQRRLTSDLYRERHQTHVYTGANGT